MTALRPLLCTLCVIVAAALAPLPALAGNLRVRVVFNGRYPRMGQLHRTDPACGGSRYATEETAVVDLTTGGLKNTLVWVSKGAPPPSAPQDAELQSQSCMFRPRVAAVSGGGVVRLLTSDSVPHIWHIFHGMETLRVQKVDNGASVVSELKLKPGDFVHLRDDTRPWMDGFVVVVNSALNGVTAERGDVTLEDLPAGDYQISTWHERYGVRTGDVKVEAEGAAELKIIYDGTEARP